MVVPRGSSRVHAPGQSPFHAKGNLWLGIRDFVEQRVDGGVPAVLKHLAADVAAFFTQELLAVSWYDVLPAVDVAAGIAKAMGVTVQEYQRVSAVWQAERDLNGAYAPVLKRDTPEGVCRRFANIYSLMYDFGRVEILSVEGQSVRACCYGMPEPLAAWWMNASEFYTDYVLFAAGGRNPRLVWDPTISDGERSGVPLVRIPSTTAWD
ncbi:MAG TPA: hypothetical protein VHE30_25760 [Polyangiaceae bacterium]|nr:hypothetical protein [Polyangiaceae bacterium]